MRNHSFKLPVGDWSADGHGMCDYFIISSSEPMDVLETAYFRAKEMMPEYAPSTFLDEYEDFHLPEHIQEKILELGIGSEPDNGSDYCGDWGFETYQMAQYWVWFVKQGNQSIDLEVEPEDRKRHIHFRGEGLGYGMFML